MACTRIAGPLLGFLLISTTATGGNDPDLLVSEGVICLQPECDVTKPGSVRLVAPPKGAPALIDRVKNVPAASLEAGLPAISFESWLHLTLTPYVVHADSAFWHHGFCDEPGTAMPQAGPDLCIETEVALTDERTVHIAVEAAKVINPQSTRLIGWRVTEPTIRRIYVQNGEHSIAVKTLANLAAQLMQSPDEWATVDLKADLKWSPVVPKPGDTVTFTFSVSNLGKQDLERAQIKLQVTAPNHVGQVTVIRPEWFPSIPSGKTVTVAIAAQLPRGEFSAHLSADPFDGIRRIRDANPHDNEVVVYHVVPHQPTVVSPNVPSEILSPP